jgi:hypothetical protein
MKNVLFIIIIILLIILILKVDSVNKKYENFNDTNFSTQALQNIAKVYGDASGTVTFNNVKITNALTVDTSFNMIPRGCIIAYNAEVAPAGWAICDGSNGTPDLRGRFIRMWYQRKGTDIWGDELPVVMPNAQTDVDGNSEKIKNSFYGDVSSNYTTKMMNHWFGDNGGTDWRLPIIKEMPAHDHTISWAQPGWNLGHGGGSYNVPFQGPGVTDIAGNSWGYGIQPPYYVLTYIMKL